MAAKKKHVARKTAMEQLEETERASTRKGSGKAKAGPKAKRQAKDKPAALPPLSKGELQALVKPSKQGELFDGAVILPYASPTGLSITDAITIEQWAQLGGYLAVTHRAQSWWVGDWLLYSNNFDENQCIQIAEALQFADQTLLNYRSIAAAYLPSERMDGLSFAHHSAAAYIKKPERKKLLERARKEHWNIKELRQAVKSLRKTRVREHQRRLDGQDDDFDEVAAISKRVSDVCEGMAAVSAEPRADKVDKLKETAVQTRAVLDELIEAIGEYEHRPIGGEDGEEEDANFAEEEDAGDDAELN